jgi:hypothetical protein
MSIATHMPYEGAGFLLTYDGKVILGQRIKKEKDMLEDPTLEVEYMGGKVEPSDGNDPFRTAHAELVEELGQDILLSTWRDRVDIIHIFQPFSKKWIWCFKLELAPAEYDNILDAAAALSVWFSSEERDFSSITGRPTRARKAIAKIVTVPLDRFREYIDEFATNTLCASSNRMKDAKAWRNTATPLGCFELSSDKSPQFYGLFPLRAFNMVMFEKHLDLI